MLDPSAKSRGPTLHIVTLSFWLCTSLAWGVLLSVLSVNQRPDLWLLLALLLVALCGYALSLLLASFARKAYRHSFRSFLLATGVLVVAITLIQAAVDVSVWTVINNIKDGGARPPAADAFGYNVIIYLWLFASYAAAIGVMLAADAADRRARQIMAAEEVARKAAIQRSRYRISPAVLGNAFRSAWDSLDARNDPGAADGTVQRFSEYLRWVLSAPADGLATIGDEITAVESFLAVGDANGLYQLEVKCPPDLYEARIPAYLLQALVECVPGVADGHSPQIKIELESCGAAAVISLSHSPGVGTEDIAAFDADKQLQLIHEAFASEGVVIMAPVGRSLKATVRLYGPEYLR